MHLAAALVILVLLVAAMVWAAVRGRRAAAGVVVLLSVLWVVVNKPIEGTVLLSITSANGITSSDLLSGLGLATALVAVARPAARRPEHETNHRTGPGT